MYTEVDGQFEKKTLPCKKVRGAKAPLVGEVMVTLGVSILYELSLTGTNFYSLHIFLHGPILYVL